MKNIRKSSFAIIAALVLVGSFSGYKIAEAVRGEGTATIALDGGGASSGVSVVKNTSHVFTVVLTVGDSGITADAENPTFTIPTGFTAPDATYVANAGLVVADGNWSVIGGGTCLVESPVAGLTKAVGQVITVDVSTMCTVGGGGTITLTYKGTSATVGTLPVDIGTNDEISYIPVKSISLAPNNATLPTITVTDITTATLKVIKHVVNNNGGLLDANNWTLTVSSSNGGSGTGFALGAESPGTTYTLEAGHQYSVAESGGSSGYNNTSLSSECTIPSAVGGTTYTCTITNDDIAPSLTLDNVVVNDIKVKKEASDYSLRSGPKSVTFTYRVTNQGDVALSDISVKDDKCDSVDYVSGDDNNNDLLDTTESWKYTCKKTVKKTETNTVTAKGTANGEEVKDTDTAKVTVSIPGLPNVGVSPADENNNFWSNIVQQLSSLFTSRK